MKAWEYELNSLKSAIPQKITENQAEDWFHYVETGTAYDKKLIKDWISFVPGSKSPCRLVVSAIQCMHNKGYDVTEAEQYIDKAMEYALSEDVMELQKITSKVYTALNNAKKIPNNDYDKYQKYSSWDQIEKSVTFPNSIPVDVFSQKFKDDIKVGWLSQFIGGALGTQIEGFTTENIIKVYGEVRDYLRAPETYNDDITYEIAFLEIFSQKGYDVTSEDIGLEWLALCPDGYSAEEVAIRNLRLGFMPPLSGTLNNYYDDWIGVQMRTNVHGMVAPGNPKLAAELSIRDGIVSHTNSGILGGMFNAVLTSLSFVETDTKELLTKTIECIPHDSEFYQVVKFAHNQCLINENWKQAWSNCEKQYEQYNWIHCYPNICAQIIAIYFGNGDFDETAYIIAMAGMDTDCTAGPVLNVLGIMVGIDKIDKKWINPIGTEIKTYLRKYNEFTLDELCDKTILSVQNAIK